MMKARGDGWPTTRVSGGLPSQSSWFFTGEEGKERDQRTRSLALFGGCDR